MVEKLFLDHAAIESAVHKLYDRVSKTVRGDYLNVYPIPRGGIPIAYMFKAVALLNNGFGITIVELPELADIFIDDVFDSGATAKRYTDQYKKPFFSAFTKNMPTIRKKWLVFPWEVGEDHAGSGKDTVTRMLQQIGEDPDREGLLETPSRVIKAWETWFGGYSKKPADVLKVFKDGAEGVDQIVLETDIPVYSHCEHHLAPIFGVAHVGYIPSGSVVGLSKLVRLVDIFSRRLQIQERLTNQIADALADELRPEGVGVILQCRHLCMESRGVRTSGVITTTSALRGALKDEHDARAEFLSLINMTRAGGPL